MSATAFDPAVFARLAARITYVPLDVASSAHWADLAARPGGRRGPAAPVLPRDLARPVRPDLRRCWCGGHRDAAVPRRAGKADRPRPRLRDPHQRRGRPRLRRIADLPDRPLSREGVGPEPAGAALRQLAVRVGLEPGAHRPRPDHRGRDGRRRGAGAPTTTSPAPCATWCRTTCCSCSAWSPWSRRPRWRPIRCATRSSRCCARCARIADGEALQKTVRGQYRAGAGGGMAVPGYAEELGAPSRTETFVALKAEIENWRWAGVPFYLRTGKRLPTRVSEIVIQFHKVPHSIFPRRRRRDRAQPADHPPAAGRRHPARADGQGPGPGRHAAAQRPARHPLRRRLQGPLSRRL